MVSLLVMVALVKRGTTKWLEPWRSDCCERNYGRHCHYYNSSRSWSCIHAAGWQLLIPNLASVHYLLVDRQRSNRLHWVWGKEQLLLLPGKGTDREDVCHMKLRTRVKLINPMEGQMLCFGYSTANILDYLGYIEAVSLVKNGMDMELPPTRQSNKTTQSDFESILAPNLPTNYLWIPLHQEKRGTEESISERSQKAATYTYGW